MLLSAIASHLMAAEVYNYLFNPRNFHGVILAISVAFTVVCLVVLKSAANLWAWTALATFVLLQLLCLGLHHGQAAFLVLIAPMYWLYIHALENARDELAVRHQITFDESLSTSRKRELQRAASTGELKMGVSDGLTDPAGGNRLEVAVGREDSDANQESLPMIHEVTSEDDDFVKASALIQFFSPISEKGRTLIAALPEGPISGIWTPSLHSKIARVVRM